MYDVYHAEQDMSRRLRENRSGVEQRRLARAVRRESGGVGGGPRSAASSSLGWLAERPGAALQMVRSVIAGQDPQQECC